MRYRHRHYRGKIDNKEEELIPIASEDQTCTTSMIATCLREGHARRIVVDAIVVVSSSTAAVARRLCIGAAQGNSYAMLCHAMLACSGRPRSTK